MTDPDQPLFPRPWHELRGEPRIRARWQVVRAAQVRDPGGDTWTADEHRAADEEDEARDQADVLYPTPTIKLENADDCTRCSAAIEAGVEGALCRRCALRLAALVAAVSVAQAMSINPQKTEVA